MAASVKSGENGIIYVAASANSGAGPVWRRHDARDADDILLYYAGYVENIDE